MTDFDLELCRGADGLFPRNIVELLIGQDPERRRVDNAIRSILVGNSRYYQAYNLLRDILVTSGGGQEGQCAFLYGPSGVGKSTVLNVFEGEYGQALRTEAGFLRPVLRINVPGRPDLGSLYTAILDKLGAADFTSRNVNAMKVAVDRQLRNQQTRVLILDEFTHVIEDKTERFTKMVVRELKGFISENVVDVVFVGTDEIMQITDLYAQIQRRAGGSEVRLAPFDWQDDDDRAEWIDWLEIVDGELPIPSETPLHDRDLAKKFHLASHGLVNSAMKLLLFASLDALQMGDGKLRQEHFWQGFETGRTIFSGRDQEGKIDRSSRNPFDEPKRRKAKVRLIQTNFVPEDTAETYLRGRKREPKASFAK